MLVAVHESLREKDVAEICCFQSLRERERERERERRLSERSVYG